MDYDSPVALCRPNEQLSRRAFRLPLPPRARLLGFSRLATDVFATLALVGILLFGLFESLSPFALTVTLLLTMVCAMIVANGISTALVTDLYVNNAHFGTMPFSVLVSNKTFVGYASKTLLISLPFMAGGITLMVIFFLNMVKLADHVPESMLVMMVLYHSGKLMLGWMLVIVGALIARAYSVVAHRNYIFNHAKLGSGRLYFASHMKVLPYVALLLTNDLMVIFSGGLATPFAQIRHARYLIETLDVVGDIDALSLQNHGEEATTGALEEQVVLKLDIQPGNSIGPGGW